MLADLNVKVVVDVVKSITTEDGTVVTEPAFIKEFYTMSDFKTMRALQEKLKQYGEQASAKPVDTKCASCGHEYKVPLAFDYANFFADAS